MHQPFYKDTLSGRYRLPWVRLHAAKDYLHMAEVLSAYPKVRATFNFVPSLVEQIDDYAAGRAEDDWASISRRESFDETDKQFMLASFFSISWDRFVRRYPRYWQLLQIRNQLDGSIELLGDQYWRDLAVWFNLAWIAPSTIAAEPALAALVERGREFGRADVETVLDHHRRICGQVLPAYRALRASGQIELSTSPYFHPILPLLIDTRAAREASPRMTLPNVLFASAEDAVEQLRLARAAHEAAFGAPPTGLWPSEGAVSQAVGERLTGDFADGAWRWAATDEAILAGSIGVGIDRDGDGRVQNPGVLYQPYRFGDTGLSLVFRDRVLSDRIGFVYRHFDGRQAAEDLIGRLHDIRDRLAGEPEPHLVPIVLDGENCWEEYPDNGSDFLHGLYDRLSRDDSLRTVTLTEYLAENPPRARIERLRAGSWIFGNLETWIGEEEQNRAWEYLALTRGRLVQWQRENPDADPARRAAAWRSMYTAEGSDWFWWYYSRNKFGQEQMFDAEFRAHLGNVYRAVDLPVPAWLARPISGPAAARWRLPGDYISPRLSTEPHPTLEWTNAGYLDAARSTGAMQQGGGVLRRLYYGYNPADLYLRLEANEDLTPAVVSIYIATTPPSGTTTTSRDEGATSIVPSGTPFAWRIAIAPDTTGPALFGHAATDGGWTMDGFLSEVAAKGPIVELAIPIDRIGVRIGATIGIVIAIARDGRIVETLPSRDDDNEQLSISLIEHG